MVLPADSARVRVTRHADSCESKELTLLRELRDRPGTLQFDDGLPYDFDALLTPAGLKYAQEPSNLERYWRLHAGTFKPAPFEGSWTRPANGRTQFDVSVTAPSVTVIVVPPVSLVESH